MEKIQSFVQDGQKLYGDQFIVLNVHLLYHLPRLSILYGPFWTTWAFPFEKMLGWCKSLLHGKRNIGAELMKAIKLVHTTNLYEQDAIRYITKNYSPEEKVATSSYI